MNELKKTIVLCDAVFQLDEGFCGDKDDLQLVSSDADCTSDGSHWVSQWHGVDFGAPKLRSTWDQFGQLVRLFFFSPT